MGCALAFQARETGSSPVLRSMFASVMELVYILVLETKFWGFESLQTHHYLLLKRPY